MRNKLLTDMKAAMKSQSEIELSTLRLVNAAIKSKDIDHRGKTGSDEGISDAEIVQVLAKMVKQRQESIESFKKAKRKDLMEREVAEIAVISRYLPKAMDEREVELAILDAIKITTATSLKDMGRVVSYLKEKYMGQMDFAAASSQVKKLLGA